jgi:hypothetical protein
MILANVNIGTGQNAGNGDPLRTAFNIINENFEKVESNVNALTNSVSSVAGRTGNVTITTVDVVGITNYATKTDLNNAIANVSPATSTYGDSNVAAYLPTYSGNIAALITANVNMKGYVDNKVSADIAALIDSAPATLDTLNELAAAIGDDPGFASNIAANVATLFANAGSQHGAITSLQSGVSNLSSNAAAQQSTIGNLAANISSINDDITLLNANVTTANLNVVGYIDQSNLRMKGYVDAVTTAWTANAGSQHGAIASLQSGFSNLASNAAAQQSEISALQANILYSNANVASYLTTYSGDIQLEKIVFDDLSEQTTAYTGQSWRTLLESTLTSKPTWLSYYPDGSKPTIGTNFGFDPDGMWFKGTADGQHAYPIRTNVPFQQTDVLEVVTTIDYDQTSDDFGFAIFLASTTQPFWQFGTDLTRIAFQFSTGTPEIRGRTTSQIGSNSLTVSNTYAIKFTYDPTAESDNVTVVIYDGATINDSVLETLTLSEVLPAGEYLIGFDSDQDQSAAKSYYTSLTIKTLANAVFNDVDVVNNLTVNNSLSFADNSTQTTAYTATYANAAPTPTSVGTKGNIVVNGAYMYHCIAANTWVRTSITTSW